jgi:hypothetical protein
MGNGGTLQADAAADDDVEDGDDDDDGNGFHRSDGASGLSRFLDTNSA